MKKVILILAVFCSGIFIGEISAQTVGIYNDNGQNVGGDTIEYFINVDTLNPYQEFVKDNIVVIINTSNDTNTYKLTRIEHQFITGTKDYLCWGATCFPSKDAGSTPSWDPDESISLAPGDTAGTKPGIFGLKIYFQPEGQIGEALYEYQIYNANDPMDKNNIYVKFNLGYLTSLEKQKAVNYDFSIYPNPVSNVANVDIDLKGKNGEYTLIVKDILGQDIKQKRVQAGANNVQLDMSAYSKGIYFVSLINQQEVLKTKKLIVK